MNCESLGTVQLTKIIIDEFKKTDGQFKNATHKFYTVRKKLANDTNCDKFLNVKPDKFFYALKCTNESEKLKSYSTQRNASSYQSRLKKDYIRYKTFDGDFDDLDCSKQSNEYFYHNKSFNREE